MTTAERRKTRLSAFFVVCIAVFILTVAYFMLFVFAGSDLDDDFGIIKIGFMAFFGLITLFIVGVNIYDAIRATKMVRTGTVTAKDVRSSRGKDADSNAQFVVLIDGTDCTVDELTFKRINVGETITLTTTRSGNSVLDLRVLEDPRHTADGMGRDVLEPLDPASRRAAWWAFIKCFMWRLVAVGLSTLLPIMGILIALAIDSSLASHPLLLTIYKIAEIALPLVVALLLIKMPWNLMRDIIQGQSLNEVRTIRDVVTSNRRLIGKTGTMSGWGDVTTYSYIDTGEAFLLCSPFPTPVVGKQVVISRLPHSRVVLGVYVLD